MTLKEWRKQNGFTQDQLGGQIGVSGVTVSRYETGERIPENTVMQSIFSVTAGEVTPNDFYGVADCSEGSQPDRVSA